ANENHSPPTPFHSPWPDRFLLRYIAETAKAAAPATQRSPVTTALPAEPSVKTKIAINSIISEISQQTGLENFAKLVSFESMEEPLRW
ncbi:MAG: hypothetical protein WD406_06130, partial [Pseudohongiellaceae bacterium]